MASIIFKKTTINNTQKCICMVMQHNYNSTSEHKNTGKESNTAVAKDIVLPPQKILIKESKPSMLKLKKKDLSSIC